MPSLLKIAAKAVGLAWFALTVSGCGQKGPLYLPVPAASAASNPSNPSSK